MRKFGTMVGNILIATVLGGGMAYSLGLMIIENVNTTKSQKNLEKEIVNFCKDSEVVKDIESYEFLSADFSENGKDGDKYKLDINGFVKAQKNSGYLGVSYDVEKSLFTKALKSSEQNKVLDAVLKVVKTYEASNVSYAPVTDRENFDKTVIKELNDNFSYKYYNAKVYSASDIEINEKDNSVSFLSKEIVCYKTSGSDYGVTFVRTNPVVLIGSFGDDSKYEYYDEVHKITFNVTAEQLKEIKINPSAAYLAFVDIVNKNKENKCTVERISQQHTTNYMWAGTLVREIE